MRTGITFDVDGRAGGAFACSRRRSLGAAPALLLFAVTACQSIYDQRDPDVRLATSIVWAGGEIVLNSAALRGPDTLPVVLLGGDTSVVRFAAPDSLILRAPDSAGLYPVSVAFYGRSPLPVGSVRVGGAYRGTYVLPDLAGFPLLWPGGARPSFLMRWKQGGLALVDPRFRTVAPVLPPRSPPGFCGFGPGPGADGAVVAQRPGCGAWMAFDPSEPDTIVDVPPCGIYRYAAQLSADYWICDNDPYLSSCRRDTSGNWSCALSGHQNASHIAASPDRRYAVPVSGGTDQLGHSLFSTASVIPRRVLPGYSIGGAAFSEASDTLFVAWARLPYGIPGGLASIRSSDGAVLVSRTVMEGVSSIIQAGLGTIAPDPGRPWLFVATHRAERVGSAADPTYSLVLYVVDRATLSPIGALPAVALGGGPALLSSDFFLAVAGAERRLFVVETYPYVMTRPAGVRIFEFDLLP